MLGPTGGGSENIDCELGQPIGSLDKLAGTIWGPGMRALERIGAVILGISIVAAFIFATVLLINGTVYVNTKIFPYLLFTVTILVVVCIMILLPLSLFRRTRMIPAYGFLICSFAFGLFTWLCGFLMTYDIWGGTGIVIGMLLAGVGVVPLGMIASALHSEWSPVVEIMVGLALTFGAHFFSLFLASKLDQA